MLMDGYYHLLEVRFRELYRTTAELPIQAGSDMLLEAPRPTSENVWKVIKSPTVFPFYVLLLFALGIALKEVDHEHAAKIETVPVAVGDARSRASGPNSAKLSGQPKQSAKADERAERPVGNAATATEDKRAGNVR
jgi:hypothetical protein